MYPNILSSPKHSNQLGFVNSCDITNYWVVRALEFYIIGW